MFEERRWGSYRVLDYQKLDDGTEVWTNIEVTGQMVIGSQIARVRPGYIIRIHPEQWHAIRADERLMFIEVQRGQN